MDRRVGEVSYFLASVEFELRCESSWRTNAPSLYFDKRDHKSTGAARHSHDEVSAKIIKLMRDVNGGITNCAYKTC